MAVRACGICHLDNANGKKEMEGSSRRESKKRVEKKEGERELTVKVITQHLEMEKRKRRKKGHEVTLTQKARRRYNSKNDRRHQKKGRTQESNDTSREKGNRRWQKKRSVG